MTKYRYVGAEPRRMQVGIREVAIEPGDIVDIPDTPGVYVQTGEHNEVPLFERHTTTKPAASRQKESE